MSFVIGYQRRRATMGGAFEGSLTTVILLVAGIVVVTLIVLRIFQINLPGT